MKPIGNGKIELYLVYEQSNENTRHIKLCKKNAKNKGGSKVNLKTRKMRIVMTNLKQIPN